MKRTFTVAAAVLAGGAGAVGFAATATAAETPQLPASLPTDNGVANTAFHAAGTLASAQKTVGDVVPLDEHLTGRSSDPVSQVVGGTPAAGLLKPVVNAVQNASTGHTHNLDPSSALDEVPLPVGSTLPAGKSGLPGLDALGPVTDVAGGLPVADSLPVGKSGLPGLDALAPVTDIAGSLPLASSLPVGKSGATDALPTTLTGTLDQVTQTVPQTKPGQAQAPTNIVGDTVGNALESNTELGGAPLPAGKSDPVSGLAGGLPVVSDVQGLTGKAGSPMDKVTDVVSHGPLGSATQLGN